MAAAGRPIRRSASGSRGWKPSRHARVCHSHGTSWTPPMNRNARLSAASQAARKQGAWRRRSALVLRNVRSRMKGLHWRPSPQRDRKTEAWRRRSGEWRCPQRNILRMPPVEETATTRRQEVPTEDELGDCRFPVRLPHAPCSRPQGAETGTLALLRRDRRTGHRDPANGGAGWTHTPWRRTRMELLQLARNCAVPAAVASFFGSVLSNRSRIIRTQS